jgi:hypothetical protein
MDFYLDDTYVTLEELKQSFDEIGPLEEIVLDHIDEDNGFHFEVHAVGIYC